MKFNEDNLLSKVHVLSMAFTDSYIGQITTFFQLLIRKSNLLSTINTDIFVLYIFSYNIGVSEINENIYTTKISNRVHES